MASEFWHFSQATLWRGCWRLSQVSILQQKTLPFTCGSWRVCRVAGGNWGSPWGHTWWQLLLGAPYSAWTLVMAGAIVETLAVLFNRSSRRFFFFFFNIYLSWPYQVLDVALRIFNLVFVATCHQSTQTLSCSTWALVPWPGVESRSPKLGVQSHSHWSTGEVPPGDFFTLKFENHLPALVKACCSIKLTVASAFITDTIKDQGNRVASSSPWTHRQRWSPWSTGITLPAGLQQVGGPGVCRCEQLWNRAAGTLHLSRRFC